MTIAKTLRSLTTISVVLCATLAPGLAGADGDVTIIRDQWGVAHVYAEDENSLFFGNGYAQAQDRLAQMEILRHVGKGELAKLAGPSGLTLDLVTRRELYTHQERLAALEALEPRWREAFASYTAGVNRWIDEVRKDPSKLPVEYPALVVTPEPWHETDTIAIAQYLLDVFGRGGGGGEEANAKLLDALEQSLGSGAPEAFRDLVWGKRTDTYTTIKPEDAPAWPTPAAEYPHDLASLPQPQQEAIGAAVAAKPVDDTRYTVGGAAPDLASASAAAGLPFRLGSNAQLVDERFSANGKPLLFGGPQMAYFTPMVPYEIGLHGGGFDVVGMGIAGAPGVIIGRTAHASWTVTSGSSDQVDTVAEKLVGPRHYLVDGEVKEMDCRTETHLVRPGPADFAPEADPGWRPPTFDVVKQEVCRTIHGPVLSRTPDGQYAFASHRSYRGDEVRSGSLWLQVGSTKNIQEFQDLFDDFKFEFNFNYADDSGNIAYFHFGAQPVRDAALDPRLPRPGWISDYEWDDVLMGEELPHIINPASGYSVNWNNNPAVGWPTGDIREAWGTVHRAELMEAALAPVLARGNVTMDDLRAVNEYASTHEPFAGDFVPTMRASAVAAGDDAAVAALDAWTASGFDWADRNKDGNHDHAGFRLYELWRERMQTLVFADEIGDKVRKINWDPPTSDDPHAADHGNTDNKHTILDDVLDGRTTHSWCDNISTDVMESCADLSLAALQASTAGGAWDDPFKMRKIKFVALGAGPAYEIPMVNRPSFQHFYDWGLAEGPDRSRNALPPGNSAHMNGADFLLLQGARNGFPGATPPKHLEDQLQMYVNFQDKPLLFSRASVDRYADSTIELSL